MNVSRLFRTALLSVLAFVLVGGIMAAQAQETFFVDGASGSDANDGTGPNDAFATIQQAFDAASNGDVIEIDGSAFYDETATLTKNLDVRVRQESPVRVNALVLDAGENTSSSTSSDERAQIADSDDESNGDLQVVNSLEVISGFYEFTGGGADLELEDGAALTWSAGESSNGGSDNRFRSEQGQSGNAVRIALDGSSYNLELATSETYDINAGQIPDASGSQLADLTVNNSGDIGTPSAVTVNGTLIVNDGSRISPSGGTISAKASVANNGRIDRGNALALNGASGAVSGSGTFGDVSVESGSYFTNSPITVSGVLDIKTGGSLTLTPSDAAGTAGGGIELIGAGEVLNLDGDAESIIGDNESNQITLAGSDAQQVDLNADRTIDFLTVDKGGVNPVTIANSGGNNRALTVDENLNIADGRVQLTNGEGFLGSTSQSTDLVISGNATIDGSVILATATSSSNDGSSSLSLDVSSGGNKTISGNGQIAVPLVADVSGDLSSGADRTVTFSDLSSISAFTKKGDGDVAFGQQVSVSGLVNAGNGDIFFSSGTAEGSSGTLNLVGGNVTSSGSAALGAIVVSSNPDGRDGTTGLTYTSISGAGGAVTSSGALAVNGDANLTGGGTSPNAELNLVRADGSSATLTSSVGGTITLDSDAALEVAQDASGRDGSHTLNANGGIDLSSGGDFTVTSNGQFGLGSGSIDLSAATVTFDGDLRLFSGGTQDVTVAGGTTIGDLIVENSRSEEDGDVDPVEINDNTLTVADLSLLDGEVSQGTSGGNIEVSGATAPAVRSVVRAEGSITSSALSSLPSNYNLTYTNSPDITTGNEFASGNVDVLSVEGSGAVALSGNSDRTINTALAVASGATLNSNGNNLTVSSPGSNVGTPAQVNGSFAGDGALIVSGSNSFTVAGSGSISNLESSLSGGGNVLALGLSSDATVGSLINSGGTIQTVDGALSSVEGAVDLTGGSGLTLRENLTVGGEFTHNSGNVLLGTDGASLTLNGESNTINGSGAGYAFNGNGRVVFAGDAAQSLAIPSDIRINRVEIDNSEGVTLTDDFALTTTDLVLTDGTLSHGTQLVAQAGDPGSGRITVVNGSLDGDFETGTRPTTVEYNHTDDITAGSELSGDVQNVVIDGDGTVTADNSFTVTNNLNLSSGTFAAGEQLTFGDGSQVNRSGGSLTGSPSVTDNLELTVRYSGEGNVESGPELVDGAILENVILDADQTVNLNGNASTFGLTVNQGTVDLVDDSLTVFGNATVDGNAEASGDGALVLDGGFSPTTVSGSYTSLPTVVAAKDRDSDGSFRTATIQRTDGADRASVSINGDLRVTSGNLALNTDAGSESGSSTDDTEGNDAPGQQEIVGVSVAGDFDVQSGARQFDPNDGDVTGDVDGDRVSESDVISISVAGDYNANPGSTDDRESFADFTPLDFDGAVVLDGDEQQSVFQRGAPSGVSFAKFDFAGFEVDNEAGVTAESPIITSTLALESGTVSMGENLLAVTDGDSDAVSGTGTVNGTLQRTLGDTRSEAGTFEFPLSADGSLQEATIVTDENTLSSNAVVTVTTQGTELAGDQGLPFTAGSGADSVRVNAKAPVGWTVSFDPDAGTPAAGEAPDFRFRAQGLEGIGDVNQLRVISRAGEGETGNPFSVAGTHEDALFSGGIPLAVSSGVGGFDISNTQQFTFGSDSAVNDFADADQPATQEIAGTVTYPTVENGDLVGGRSIEGAEVTVSSSDTTATATTGANGEYQIDGLPSGDFDVEVSVSDSVENVSIADALRLIRGSAGTDPFAGAFQREQVADVNDSGTANATDALRIARFDLGLADGFQAGDFATESESVTLESDGVTGVELFVAEVGDVDLSGGDTGGSSQTLAASTISPKQAAAATQSSSASSPETGVKAGETFEVPVRMGRSAEVGSYRMTVNYSAETASFEGVKSAQEGVLTNASSDGTLQVSWFDQSGESALDLRNGSELVTLQFKASEDVKKKEFAPKVTSGEITDSEATPLAAGVELQAVQIGASAPDKFALNGNYPNPVRGQATIDMDLPTSGNVTVEVYNVLGQRVQTMERSMSAGSGQTIKIDGSNLASGQYFYRVEADLEDGSARETGRITVVK